MPQRLQTDGARWQLLFYVIESLMLSTAPAWIREAIVAGYDPADTMGSPGDVFIWFGMVILATLVNALVQIIFFFVPSTFQLSTRALLILFSALLWVTSMWWVHLVGLP